MSADGGKQTQFSAIFPMLSRVPLFLTITASALAPSRPWLWSLMFKSPLEFSQAWGLERASREASGNTGMAHAVPCECNWQTWLSGYFAQLCHCFRLDFADHGRATAALLPMFALCFCGHTSSWPYNSRPLRSMWI